MSFFSSFFEQPSAEEWERRIKEQQKLLKKKKELKEEKSKEDKEWEENAKKNIAITKDEMDLDYPSPSPDESSDMDLESENSWEIYKEGEESWEIYKEGEIEEITESDDTIEDILDDDDIIEEIKDDDDDPEWFQNLNIDDEDNIKNLRKIIRKIKKYRDEKIFDHLNIPASFIPIAGPITNIIHGSRRGSTSEIVSGSIFLAFDIVTLGAVSLLKAGALGAEKVAVTSVAHMGDIARGIRQGAKGLKPLVFAARDAKGAVMAANVAKGALQTGKVVSIGVKAGGVIVSSSNSLRLGITHFNREEQEIIILLNLIRHSIGENLYNTLDENIISYINNPICSPRLNPLIVELENVLNRLELELEY